MFDALTIVYSCYEAFQKVIFFLFHKSTHDQLYTCMHQSKQFLCLQWCSWDCNLLRPLAQLCNLQPRHISKRCFEWFFRCWTWLILWFSRIQHKISSLCWSNCKHCPYLAWTFFMWLEFWQTTKEECLCFFHEFFCLLQLLWLQLCHPKPIKYKVFGVPQVHMQMPRLSQF